MAVAESAFEKESFAKKVQEEKRQFYAVVSSNLARMAANPDLFMAYLNVQSHMPQSSVGNCMMLAIQCPSACNVKLATTWTEHGVKPLKGTRGIAIMVPTKKYTKKDGTIAQGYDLRRVFDVMQTTAGEDYIKQGPPRIQKRKVLRALMEYQQGAWQFHSVSEGEAAKYTIESQTITIRTHQAFETLFPALLKEVTCADLVLGKNMSTDNAYLLSICVSYMLCHKYRIPTPNLILPSPTQIMGDNPEQYVVRLNQLVKTYRTMLHVIESAGQKEGIT